MNLHSFYLNAPLGYPHSWITLSNGYNELYIIAITRIEISMQPNLVSTICAFPGQFYVMMPQDVLQTGNQRTIAPRSHPSSQ